MGDDFHEIVVDQLGDIVDDEIHFAIRQRVVLPILYKSLVVGVDEFRDPGHHILVGFELQHAERAALLDSFRQTVDALRKGEFLARDGAGDEIHFLAETEGFHQAGVIRVVVGRHHHGLAVFKPIHQHAVTVERAKPLRPLHAVQSAFARPGEGGFEQRFRHLRVVDGFEQEKRSQLAVVIPVVGFVFQDGDPPRVGPVLHGDEEIRVGVFEEGMLLPVELQG